MQQLLMYIEEKHYNVRKKLLMSVLYGTQILYFNPMIFWLEHVSLVENTEAHSFPRSQTGSQCSLAIMYNLFTFLFFSEVNSLYTASVKRTCYLFLLIKIYVKNLFKFNIQLCEKFNGLFFARQISSGKYKCKQFYQFIFACRGKP